jgi:hypothetical protein
VVDVVNCGSYMKFFLFPRQVIVAEEGGEDVAACWGLKLRNSREFLLHMRAFLRWSSVDP